MTTGRDLLKLLKSLPDAELDRPLSVPGHYGEHNDLGLPALRSVRQSAFRSKEMEVLAFPHVDIGPEPD